MNNLKSFLVSLWINVKETINKATNFITNFDFAKEHSNDLWKAKECLRRARNSYLSLTGFPVQNLVTAYSIDRVVRSCRTKDDFINSLERAGANDELYCFLLMIAIFEVYKSNEPPNLPPNFSPLLK